MKIKVGQRVRIGKTQKCISALHNFYLDDPKALKSVLGRVARVLEVTTFKNEPAAKLSFRRPDEDFRSSNLFYPQSVLQKP